MIDRRQPVRVYWNYKHRCYSIFQCGAVRASARAVQLADVSFRVREPARRRMVAEGRKIIHAYAIGHLVDFVHPADERRLAPFTGSKVSYDPYQHVNFVNAQTGESVHQADVARFDEQGVHVADARPVAA